MSNSLQMRTRTYEIAKRMLDGAKTGELLAEYSQKWSCSTRTIDRIIAHAKDKITGKLTVKELDSKLCGIASGKTLVDKVISVKGGYQTFKLPPNIDERLKAINNVLKLRRTLSEVKKATPYPKFFDKK